ncbi:MAG: gfo/Idh/MocA family oxidoreductase, partial [Planctomycetes bacterium]|nr:gfo/Idh/MocA family oxidoreductase [Planctomycetota bacterium]
MFEHSNRRTFLKQSVAGAIALHQATAHAANDKLVIGLIGCGGRGTHDAGLFQKVPNVEVAYVCDVDEDRRAAAARKLGVSSSGVV